MSDSRPSNAEIQQASETVERYRRRMAQARPYEQRLAAFERLQRASMRTLRSNPAAYHEFLKRNHHRRRADRVRQLEAELRCRGGRDDRC